MTGNFPVKELFMLKGQFDNLSNKQYSILPNNLQDLGREMYYYLNVKKNAQETSTLVLGFYLPTHP